MRTLVMPGGVWLVMLGLTVIGFWIVRSELRELETQHPTATRFMVGIVLAAMIAAPLYAFPLQLMCDWDTLVDYCGGSEACAWVAYYWNGCGFYD